jgi:hypothetical protein
LLAAEEAERDAGVFRVGAVDPAAGGEGYTEGLRPQNTEGDVVKKRAIIAVDIDTEAEGMSRAEFSDLRGETLMAGVVIRGFGDDIKQEIGQDVKFDLSTLLAHELGHVVARITGLPADTEQLETFDKLRDQYQPMGLGPSEIPQHEKERLGLATYRQEREAWAKAAQIVPLTRSFLDIRRQSLASYSKHCQRLLMAENSKAEG